RRRRIRAKLSTVISRWVAWGVASMKCSGGRLARYFCAACAKRTSSIGRGSVVDIQHLLDGVSNTRSLLPGQLVEQAWFALLNRLSRQPQRNERQRRPPVRRGRNQEDTTGQEVLLRELLSHLHPACGGGSRVRHQMEVEVWFSTRQAR